MSALDNVKKEKFAQNIVSGMTKIAAYADAYNTSSNWSKDALKTKAYRTAREDDVKNRVAELQKELEDKSIMTAKERMKTLTKIAQDEDETTKNRMQAIDIMNKMDGVYVQKVDAQIEPVSDTAEQVSAIIASLNL